MLRLQWSQPRTRNRITHGLPPTVADTSLQMPEPLRVRVTTAPAAAGAGLGDYVRGCESAVESAHTGRPAGTPPPPLSSTKSTF
jgi:hypothetical protein